ncbi:hypothetical protein Hypma_009861 [Hypsizygus marmoreus]|uniref:Uncharacterized protein n=1 Tax=Hypsizygus marmoreus TaxID=39966 RepID=A0A369JRE7_HYPMA|nr:hypothetical protein Hypma_009861 [Hypsizygus marmoreus]
MAPPFLLVSIPPVEDIDNPCLYIRVSLTLRPYSTSLYRALSTRKLRIYSHFHFFTTTPTPSSLENSTPSTALTPQPKHQLYPPAIIVKRLIVRLRPRASPASFRNPAIASAWDHVSFTTTTAISRLPHFKRLLP